MINEVTAILVQYFPTLLEGFMACLVAGFLRHANASTIELKEEKAKVIERLRTVEQKANEINANAIYTINETRDYISEYSEELQAALETIEEQIEENRSLKSTIQELKKEIIELKALARKE